jgi:hypothetical protein
MSPAGDTVATLVSLDDQETVRPVRTPPDASTGRAAACIDSPTLNAVRGTVKDTDATATSGAVLSVQERKAAANATHATRKNRRDINDLRGGGVSRLDVRTSCSVNYTSSKSRYYSSQGIFLTHDDA